MKLRIVVAILCLAALCSAWIARESAVSTGGGSPPLAVAADVFGTSAPSAASSPVPSPAPSRIASAVPTFTPAQSPSARPAPARRAWSGITNWVYWLSDPDLSAIAKSGYQLAVIDYARDGTADGRFTAAEVEALRDSTGCGRRVLAYLSIGQAEDYRSYWRTEWRTEAPAWLAEEDPDWAGNYYVDFWNPEWQALIFAYLDDILAAGFDGVYLDRVDAVDQSYAAGHEADMRAFVIAIADYARARSALGNDFGVFPQNGEALGADPQYVRATTGIGVEELYYIATNEYVSEDERAYREALVTTFRDGSRGGLVLTVDYTDQAGQIDEAYARSERQGYVPYATDVDLDRLRVNAGHEPACST